MRSARPRYRLKLWHLLAIAALSCVTTVTICLAQSYRAPDFNAANGVIHSWNAAVETLDEENKNFTDLETSYIHNPPGRVVLAPDVRAEQKKTRLRLIDAIIASHEERVRKLRDLAKYEADLP